MPEYTLGGAEAQERILIEELQKHGFSVSVIILHWFGRCDDEKIRADKERFDKVEFVELFQSGCSEYEVRDALRAKIIDYTKNHDIGCAVLFHEYTVPLIPLLHSLGIPTIYSERLDAAKIIGNPVYNKALSECDYLTANSLFASNRMKRAFDRDVVLIRNGKRFLGRIDKSRSIHVRRLLVPCRIAGIKNLDVMIRLMSRHKEKGYQIRFVGETEDVHYLERLINLARENGVLDRVEFTGYQSDMRQEYEKADVMILPSLAEGTPNVVLEAFSLGCPVITSDIPVERELLKEEALRFQSFDEEDLERAITYLEEMSDEKYEDMLSRHRQTVEEQYSIERMSTQFMELIADAEKKKCDYQIAPEEIVSDEIRFLSREHEKKEHFYRLLCEWTRALHQGKSIGNTCLRNGWKKVGIYGFKELGQLLFEELQKQKIEIQCIVDSNADNIVAEIPVIRPEEVSGFDVDILIVTAVHSFEAIKKDLSERVTCKIVSLEELIG